MTARPRGTDPTVSPRRRARFWDAPMVVLALAVLANVALLAYALAVTL